jgi:hypothetical protein
VDSFAALATLESHMTHIAGFERDQLLLLPEAVDDYVGSDNPVRFIDASSMGWTLRRRGFCGWRRRRWGVPAMRRATF